MKSKYLYIFTYDFPNLKGNDSKFIIDEIQFLSKKFKKIYLIPIKEKTGRVKKIKNVSANYKLIKEIYNLKNIFNKMLNIFICKYFWFEISKLRLDNFFKKLKKIFVERYLAECIILYVKKIEQNHKKNIFYSIWSNHTLLGFYLLKRNNIINNSFARILGRDLKGFIPGDNFVAFKNLKFINLNFVLTLNKEQRKILISENLIKKEKIFKNYLGMVKNNKFKSKLNEKCLNFASCGSLIYVKNTMEILKFIKVFAENNPGLNINYYCIGEGEERNAILDFAKNNLNLKNLDFKYASKIPKLTDFLIKKKINYFLNLSFSEGMSFSVMEALSCFIPVISSNINGNTEIIDNNKGYVVRNFSIADYKKISKLIVQDIKNNKYLIKQRKCKVYFEKFILRSKNLKDLDKLIKLNFLNS